jgi:hypothetical protein
VLERVQHLGSGNDHGPFQLVFLPFPSKRACSGRHHVAAPVGLAAQGQRENEAVAVGTFAQRSLVRPPAVPSYVGEKREWGMLAPRGLAGGLLYHRRTRISVVLCLTRSSPCGVWPLSATRRRPQPAPPRASSTTTTIRKTHGPPSLCESCRFGSRTPSRRVSRRVDGRLGVGNVDAVQPLLLL